MPMNDSRLPANLEKFHMAHIIFTIWKNEDIKRKAPMIHPVPARQLPCPPLNGYDSGPVIPAAKRFT
ncbi:MAG: hypothetical protein BGO62_01720 [Thiobacillus sp. 65-1402]|nr:MAG: hypothetical protein ABS89_08350 [Thiobacillus sp. SCN 63-1177]OJW98820.1 MAG: hypothetical protein BGO62_01720 [Thiobacillus sp. 65-1402]